MGKRFLPSLYKIYKISKPNKSLLTTYLSLTESDSNHNKILNLFIAGTPVIDYPNDYYNDAEYYNDDYDSYNSSNENYIDVDAHVKVEFLENHIWSVSRNKREVVVKSIVYLPKQPLRIF